MRQKRSHLGCLFWVALILLVIVVFLFNRPKIEQVLKTTGLTSLIAKQTTKPSGLKVTRLPPTEPQKKPEVAVRPAAPKEPSPTSAPSPVASPNGQTNGTPPAGGAPTTQSVRQPAPTAHSPGVAQSAPVKVIHQKFELYFVKIGPGGNTVLAPISTTIGFVDSPLTRTFDTLLRGASARDRSDGIRSLIPEGTKLLAASVRDGTAYLNFNDSFRFNAYGVEGYHAQLEQVVFTATQFPTVKRVQILLNGKVHRFLAPEGIAIDRPLERSSFSG